MLVTLAEQVASQSHLSFCKGPAFSTDLFYSEDKSRYEVPISKGVLGVDMETSMLYAMGTYYKIKVLSLLTVSDNIITGEASSADDRERNFQNMIKLALEVAQRMPA